MNLIAFGFAVGWLVAAVAAFHWASSSRNAVTWLAKNYLMVVLALNVYVATVVGVSNRDLTPDALPNNLLGLDLLVTLAAGVPTIFLLLVVLVVTRMMRPQFRRVAAIAAFTLASAGFAAIVFSISHETNRLASSLMLVPAGVAAGLLVRLPVVHPSPGGSSTQPTLQ